MGNKGGGHCVYPAVGHVFAARDWATIDCRGSSKTVQLKHNVRVFYSKTIST